MKQISYTSDETHFSAGRHIEDARERAKQGDLATSPALAWETLPYGAREEEYENYEVFEFQVTEKITKVEPPYVS